MKKTITLSLALLCSLFSFAQFGGYEVEIFQENYNDLVGATEASDSLDEWDDPAYEMPIGFLTDVLGYVTNTLSTANSPGGALLNTSDYDNPDGAGGFLFYLADLQDQAALGGEYSPISYITEGQPGDQIFKLEYKNAGFFNDGYYSDTTLSSVNVQFWLYEADRSWESRIGPSNLINPEELFDYENGPLVGLIDFDSTGADYVYLLNDQENPPVLDSINYSGAYNLFGIEAPEENTVIRFFRPISNTNAPGILSGISLYPTLASNQIQLEIDNPDINISETQVRIYDINGRSFYRNDQIEIGTFSIPLNQLASGQYYLSVQSIEGHKTIPFIKQ